MNNSKKQKLDWETYYKTRTIFDELRVAQLNTFDKSIMTISSSAIALSLVILTTVSANGETLFYVPLIVSWVCFSLAIVVNLISYLVAAKSLEIEIIELDSTYDIAEFEPKRRNNLVGWTKLANLVAIITFIFGVISLLYFAYLNL